MPAEKYRITFVLAGKGPGVSAKDLAQRIEHQTGMRARSRQAFKSDTVQCILVNSEDVGDMTTMLIISNDSGIWRNRREVISIYLRKPKTICCSKGNGDALIRFAENDLYASRTLCHRRVGNRFGNVCNCGSNFYQY